MKNQKQNQKTNDLDNDFISFEQWLIDNEYITEDESDIEKHLGSTKFFKLLNFYKNLYSS